MIFFTALLNCFVGSLIGFYFGRQVGIGNERHRVFMEEHKARMAELEKELDA